MLNIRHRTLGPAYHKFSYNKQMSWQPGTKIIDNNVYKFDFYEYLTYNDRFLLYVLIRCKRNLLHMKHSLDSVFANQL